MNIEISTGAKLKELREKYELTQGQLSKKTAVTRGTIARLESTGADIKKVEIKRALEEFFSSIDTHIKKPDDFDSTDETERKIPFYDAEATAGDLRTNMAAVTSPSGTINIGDLLRDSEAAIRIYGNSMLPGYPSGCVVGLRKQIDSFIQPGEVYVVETRDSRLLKRLFYRDDDPGSDFFSCYSDNTMTFKDGARDGKLAYPPFYVHRSEILSLFIVTGVIKRNVNSAIT